MRREILMPSVTPSMTDGKIARWHVSEGQSVSAGDVLVEIATSSTTLEIEAADGGRVERILVPAGTEGVKVNTPIAILFGEESRVDKRAVQAPLSFAGLEPAVLDLDPPVLSNMPVALASIPAMPGHTDTHARALTYREALRDALADEMRRDGDVFLIGADVAQNRGANKVAQGLLDAFGPRRVVSVPPLDDAMFGLAVGAAFAGLKPVVELSSWGRALEALGPYLASAAETFYLSGGAQPVPIVFRGPNGFVPGMTGQEARCVAAELARIPGLKVVQPSSASTAGALLRAAIRDPGPVAVLEHDLLYPASETVVDATAVSTLGTARIAHPGRDVTLVAAGRAVAIALEAAALLAFEGIEAEVVDLMSIRPLDTETVATSVVRTGRLVTIEEGVGEGGIGAELVAVVASQHFAFLKSAPVRIAGASVPMPYAAELQAVAVPVAGAVVRAARESVRSS